MTITHLLRLTVCCCVELPLRRRQDALPKTPAMLPEVLIEVEYTQLVVRPRALLLDGRHRCLVSVGEDHLVRNESDRRTFRKHARTSGTCIWQNPMMHGHVHHRIPLVGNKVIKFCAVHGCQCVPLSTLNGTCTLQIGGRLTSGCAPSHSSLKTRKRKTKSSVRSFESRVCIAIWV